MINDDGGVWFYKLLDNLCCYSTILMPIAIIVYFVKRDFCFSSFSRFLLVRILVYGKIGERDNDSERAEFIGDNKKSLENVPQESKLALVKKSQLSLLLFCFLGLHSSFLIWGILQEKIMTREYKVEKTEEKVFLDYSNTLSKNDTSIKFDDSQFLVCANRVFAFIVATLILVYTNIKKSSYIFSSSTASHLKKNAIAPLHKFYYSSLTNILSSWCQYEALKFVNFPTQVLAKSLKIPSVMLMSRMVSGKKYSSIEYLCAIFISSGMIMFLYGNHHANSFENVSSDQNISKLINGIIILVLYLAFDSFTSNWEEEIYHQYKISSWQMMAGVNFCSVTLTLTSLSQQDNLVPTLKLVSSCPELMRDCLILSISSTIGQFFVFYTISRFGALIFAMIMSLRQILAILLSFVIYHHSITGTSIFGILIVFTSILALRAAKLKR